MIVQVLYIFSLQVLLKKLSIVLHYTQRTSMKMSLPVKLESGTFVGETILVLTCN